MSINSDTKAFQSRMMTIFCVSADTLSAMHCAQKWLNAPKIGDGDRCGNGCRDRSQIRNCSHRGQFRGRPGGSSESTNRSARTNWKPYDCQRNEADHWELNDGSGRPSRNSNWNRLSVHAVANASIRNSKIRTKRPDPFDSFKERTLNIGGVS